MADTLVSSKVLIPNDSYIIFSFPSGTVNDFMKKLRELGFEKDREWVLNGLVFADRYSNDDIKVFHFIDKINNTQIILRDDTNVFYWFLEGTMVDIEVDLADKYGQYDEMIAFDYDIEFRKYGVEEEENEEGDFEEDELIVYITPFGYVTIPVEVKYTKGGYVARIQIDEILQLIYKYIEFYKKIDRKEFEKNLYGEQ